jgi:hypothetical protein
MQLTTAPPTWLETTLDKFMQKEMDVLDAITRKVKRITSIIGPASMIAVEQQPTSRHSHSNTCCNFWRKFDELVMC